MAAAAAHIKPLPGTKYGPAIATAVSRKSPPVIHFAIINSHIRRPYADFPSIFTVSAVGALVYWQLQAESRTMDRMFAQYQSPESEASRQRVFKDMGRADPRRSVFNVLSWGKFQQR